jgi:hypothetical protein
LEEDNVHEVIPTLPVRSPSPPAAR